MSGFALTLVLCAAALHALWNAIVKASDDRALTLAAISATNVLAGILLIALFPAPSVASWPYIAASTLIHYGYYIFLLLAYRLGDFSQVYPISRGLAPVLVALGAQAFAGETLPILAWLGLLSVSFGIIALSLPSGGTRPNVVAVAAAAGTGLFIASYTVADGIGVRLADSPFGYIGWLFVLEFPVILAVALWQRGKPPALRWPAIRLGLLGGLFAAMAYGMVIYVKAFTPLGAVSAVRESSVIFAALIGAVWFGERPWRRRVFAAVAVTAGVVALAIYA
ncbi:MAG TPA: DMT family transporter [Afifellaceae bacterium]|nr:DMT family transporter [Afifellaceae bacterium]